MVSYSNYWQYQNIVQAEPERKVICVRDSKSIMGILESSKNNFSFFIWMIKKAEMDDKMYHELFDSTLLLVSDENLRNQVGEDFFTSMDKNTALNILNIHLLNRKIHKQTLESQRLTKIYTKNKKTEIIFLNNYGNITINNTSKLIAENIHASNGLIHIIDKLLI
jgi:uncharacterized surface protein with fasciclin (FAS1) repeats